MSAVEDTEVELMVVAVVMSVVAKEDVVEGAMVKTHINLPEGAEDSWKKLVYILQNNLDNSHCNKIIIFKK